MSMNKQAGAPIERHGRKWSPLSMRDFATLQGIEGNSDKSLSELVSWSYTPLGVLNVLAVAGEKHDPLLTVDTVAEIANPIELTELVNELIELSMPEAQGSAEGNDEATSGTS